MALIGCAPFGERARAPLGPMSPHMSDSGVAICNQPRTDSVPIPIVTQPAVQDIANGAQRPARVASGRQSAGDDPSRTIAP